MCSSDLSSSAIVGMNLIVDLINLYKNPIALEKVRISGSL